MRDEGCPLRRVPPYFYEILFLKEMSHALLFGIGIG